MTQSNDFANIASGFTPDYANYDAEDVLRELCMFLNIGGFNDADLREFDVEFYMNKVKDEISLLSRHKYFYD